MTTHECLSLVEARAREGVEQLRVALNERFRDRRDIIIGVNGSYARGEVTSGSDVDVFVLGLDRDSEYRTEKEQVVEIIESLNLKPPSPGGVFENPLYYDDLLQNIGGQKDTNESITRRMLLLLEGDWLLNQSGFEAAREAMLRAYVKDSIPTDKVCRYLLNDIIRYWRTMCVDYEFKQAVGKPPGLRRIKLRFSRCMMYLAGVLAVAETSGVDANGKRSYLAASFRLRAIERVRSILGDASRGILDIYAHFLADIDQPAIRSRLESRDYERSTEYEKLRRLAREFRNEFYARLRERYMPEHDVMYALLI